MKNKPDIGILRYVEFMTEDCSNQVFGFCIEENNSYMKIASTYGNQGFTDVTTIDKSKIFKVKKLTLSKKS
mgnify:CR=1 FL=1